MAVVQPNLCLVIIYLYPRAVKRDCYDNPAAARVGHVHLFARAALLQACVAH